MTIFKRLLPPVAGVWSLLAGQLAALLWTVSVPAAAAVLAAGVFTVRSRTGALLLVAGLAIGVVGAWRIAPEPPPLKPGGAIQAQLPLRVLDYGGNGERMPRCVVTGGRFAGRVVLLRPPPETAYLYGDELEAEGTLAAPAAPVRINFLDGSGNISHRETMPPDSFSEYIERNRAIGVFYAKDARKSAEGRGLFHFLADMREKAGARLAAGLPESSGELVNAVVLGLRGQLDPETHRAFLRAGAIHLFSVSGLHVGIAALLALALFRPLPWRYRVWVVLAAVWGYTLLCGPKVPAVRAAVMISCFSVCSTFFITARKFSVLGLAAVVVLAIYPESPCDPGFQYSFLITGFLLLMAEQGRSLYLAANERRLFAPGFARPSGNRKAQLTAMAAAVAMIFLAGLPLSLRYQGLFTPWAMAVNLFLAVISPLIFALAALKLLLASAAILLDAAALCLNKAVTAAAEMFEPSVALRPSAWAAAAFIVFLALAVTRRGRWRWTAATVPALLMVWWFTGHWFQPKLAVAARGDGPSFALVADPARQAAFALGSAGYDQLSAVKDFLAERGLRRFETFTLFDPSKQTVENLAMLEYPSELSAAGIPAGAGFRKPEKPPAFDPLRFEKSRWMRGNAVFSLQNGREMLNYRGRIIWLERGKDGADLFGAGDGKIELWRYRNTELFVYEF
ncbi:MAG: ComEC/Rec2 family competence protein [Victivallaceae bacterium]|nr:ComEC/Rec2 family competence protein [Victivallaceae bacterium]